jgi:hypothetical protein
MALVALAACARLPPPPTTPQAPPRRCATSLRALVPAQATRWWIVRPRTIFDHPRLGVALARSWDDAAEQALIARAARVGYDVRTVERALVAETRTGELAVGLGSFDAARIVARLWERLLPPRRRVDGARGVARIEGMLGRTEVAVAVDAACGAAAWAEGETRLVDGVIAPPTTALDDDAEAVIVGRTELDDPRAREALGPIATRTTALDLRGVLADGGLALTLHLRGTFSPEDLVALRERVTRVAQSALLRAVGADAWTAGDAVALSLDDGALALRVTVPWAALDALGDVLRGRVNTARNTQGF